MEIWSYLKRLIVFCLIAVVCIGCSSSGDSGNDNESYAVSGYIQKGPFITGSSILIQELDGNLNPTGSLYETTTIDDLGTFLLGNQIGSRYVEVIASGFYFNEVSGSLSSANITLRALVDLSISENINVNILTTLEKDRIEYLVGDNNGLTFEDAKEQAEREVLDIFSIDEEGVSSFDQMDISQEGDSNAILLAISSVLQGDNTVAELSELISKIGLDVKEDGALEEDSVYMDEIKNNASSLNFSVVMSNLESRYNSIGLAVTAPAFKNYVDMILNENDDGLNSVDYPNTVIGTIPYGPPSYPEGVAATLDGRYVYVANYDDDTVSVIQTSNNEIVELISVGDAPSDITIQPDGSYAYVINGRDDTVSIIQTSDNTVVDTIPDINGRRIAVTPDGKYLYITHLSSDTVYMIRRLDNSVVDAISVDGSPYDIAVTPDGSYAYVSSVGADTVSMIRTSDNTLVDVISVGDAPMGLSITPDGNYVYVSNYSDSTVSVIRTSNNTVVNTISVSRSYPDSIAITSDGCHVYVVTVAHVSVIQTSDHRVVDTISVGVESTGIAITPDGNYVYVAASEEHCVYVIAES